MNNKRKRVHQIAVQEDIQLYQIGDPEIQKFVIEGGVAFGGGFQTIVKIENDLVEGKLIFQ